ncbi:MAG: malonyl CoA-acyl carrier protein transacylase [Tepidiforma sp.]|nr:ACP S-malonyltransferase [Tepidiforma sp.]GIW17752.1 MAG: malonyl CoA-acyl carrier protein transacylase [Tepidiforma sp.]
MDQELKPWSRLALIFPGQGSQHVGMGEKLAQVSRAAREVFRRADELLERNLSKLCWEGPAEELESTRNQQPASFVTSIAWLEALKERWAAIGRPFQPYLFAGHSMGEFTAAVAAESLTFEDGLRLVEARGRLMEEAGQENPGGMASILGLPEEKVLEICAEASKEGYVGLANANCEGQSVISGYLKPLKLAMELAEKAKARRVVRLPISIGSHSPLMAKASEGMAALLDRVKVMDPIRPLVGNVNADLLRTGAEVCHELKEQLTHGVQWQKTIERMRDEGADMFLEVGPGSVLTKLVRRIDYSVNSVAISDEYEGLLTERWALVEAAAR